jgi:hypothetical protein
MKGEKWWRRRKGKEEKELKKKVSRKFLEFLGNMLITMNKQ